MIIDSPPLTTVVDALPLARRSDHVVLVTRLGATRLDRLHELCELLAGNDIIPLGFAVVGTARGDSSYYSESHRIRAATLPAEQAERALSARPCAA